MAEGDKSRTFTEEIEVAGQHVVDEVTRLLSEGNVRRLVLKSEGGDIMVTVPLTASVIAGGVVVLAAPWLALLGAIVGLAAKVRIEIVRDSSANDQKPPEAG